MAQETGFHIVPLPQIFEKVCLDIQQRTETPELPTGLSILDNRIFGLHRGEITVIGARPSEGKSALSMQIACHISGIADKRVVFVSLEMTKEQLIERMFCCTHNLDSWDLRTGHIPSDFDVKAQAFKSILENMPLRIFDIYGYDYKQIEQIIESLPHPPDALFLDYIQLISTPQGGDSREAMVSYLRQMKSLAMRQNMAIVICSQLNRSATSGEPELHHLKQTGALEEVADTVLLCWWKGMAEDPNDLECDYTIRVAKQRHGKTGDVTLKFLPNRFRFRDPPRDEKF